MKFATKVLHAGIEPDPSTGAIMTPIFQTSTYVQRAPGDHMGYEYARTQNPTRSALETNLAALENGTQGICFASGMSAMDSVLKLLEPGDEVIAMNDLYGGSYRIMVRLFQRYGIRCHFIDMQDADAIDTYLNDQTKLVWIETPTNPMLSIVDIRALCRKVEALDLWVCVDNTFATPYLQRPLDLGAHIVVHSVTKYMSGHSDVVHGAVVTKDEAVAEQLRFIQNAAGAVPGPMDCFLVLRGIKTLHLRMDRSCENAKHIAGYLKDHPAVDRVIYPGFSSHRNHDVARTQMDAYGAMVSCTLKDDRMEAANRVLSGTEIFALAESLGGVESLIGHPASMTHASIPREERLKVGLTDSLIRLSIGIEDVDDLIDDLAQALG